jgi:methionyl-tRNA formyltransferase
MTKRIGMVDSICIAGKNRIAIDAIQSARRFLPDAKVFVVCNVNDDGIDMWQPSLRKFATEEGLRILKLTDAESMENLLFLSVEYDRIVKTNRFHYSSRLINIHFSKLPAYKGMYTSCLPILHGSMVSGCTLHCIDDGIDTGSIIEQKCFSLALDETAKTLYAKYLHNGARLISEMMGAMLAGRYVEQAQPDHGSTYFSKTSVNYSNLAVDLRVTAEQLSRQIRAYNHRSYQLPSILGKTISRCTTLPQRSTARPGTVIERNAEQTIVATIDFDCALTHDMFEEAEHAVMQDDTERLRSILKNDPHLAFETNARGWSLMARAAYNGHVESQAVLLDCGADPNLSNGKGTTPLMYAKDRLLSANDPKPAMQLLAAGADPYQRDYRNKTLFDYMTNAERSVFEAMATQAK